MFQLCHLRQLGESYAIRRRAGPLTGLRRNTLELPAGREASSRQDVSKSMREDGGRLCQFRQDRPLGRLSSHVVRINSNSNRTHPGVLLEGQDPPHS